MVYNKYMLLALHLLLAFASFPFMIAAIANEFFKFTESKTLLPKLSIASFIGMVSTGTVLVIRDHVPLLGACFMGLAYLGVLGVAFIGYKKLAAKKAADIKVNKD
jgi:hypothetical protein